MLSALLVTADPRAGDQIERAGELNALRVRTISAIGKAKEWLEMQHFDLVFVDTRLASGEPLEFCQAAWKKNPFCFCALFNPDGEIRDEIPARLLGCRTFSGAAAMPEIAKFLEELRGFQTDSADFGVLVVEDLDSPRDIIVRYVEQLGYANVSGVDSAHEALKTLRREKNRFFAVLTDLQMPTTDGVELIRELRADPELANIPAIILTAYGTGDKLVECLAAGASGFLVKPPQKTTLLRELQKAKRIFLSRQSPRLCRAEDAHLIEDALARMGSIRP